MSFNTIRLAGVRGAVFATLLSTAGLLPFASPSASAHDYMAGNLHIEHPWARATPPRAGVAGAYLVIENTGDEADRLLGGSTEAAKDIQVHSMSMEGDVMKMRQLSDGLEIPAGETVTLSPAGYHLMLIEPKEPLKEGDRVPATLDFKKAGKVDVELAVEGMGAGGPDDMNGMHHGKTSMDRDGSDGTGAAMGADRVHHDGMEAN